MLCPGTFVNISMLSILVSVSPLSFKFGCGQSRWRTLCIPNQYNASINWILSHVTPWSHLFLWAKNHHLNCYEINLDFVKRRCIRVYTVRLCNVLKSLYKSFLEHLVGSLYNFRLCILVIFFSFYLFIILFLASSINFCRTNTSLGAFRTLTIAVLIWNSFFNSFYHYD